MIAPARRVAYRILLQMETTDAHSDDLLREPEVDALSAQDRNLATTLVLGTLRWQLALDERIRDRLVRPNVKPNPEALTALRMGAYQLLHLDRVPAHAVLNDSVELVKRSSGSHAAGMVNAVLRQIQRSAFSVQPSGTGDASMSQEIAERWAHPEWMVERWVRRHGAEAAEAICRWDQEPAGTTLWIMAARAEADAEFPELETEPGAFLSCALRVVRGDAGRSAAVREGRARIQDEASQLVAELLAAGADHRPSGEGLRVLDTCAAPGGKTAILEERLPEARMTAMDVSRKRLDAMARARRWAAQREDHLQFQRADAATLKLDPEWDRILCDVPCSGTGTMARNPEIRLRLDEGDLARQQARQVAILRAALAGLAPGGRLVYSTCSLEPEENEDVVAAVLREVAGVRLTPVAEILDGLAASGVVTAEGRERLRSATAGEFLRTLPGVHPCDGFFAAAMERS